MVRDSYIINNQELKSFICHAVHYSYDCDTYEQKNHELKSFICHAAHYSYDRDTYWLDLDLILNLCYYAFFVCFHNVTLKPLEIK